MKIFFISTKKNRIIKKIDNDDNLYKNILKEDLLLNDNLLDTDIKEKTEFFDNIFEQDKNKAKRIDNYLYNIFL